MKTNITPYSLVLASGSPRRKELLSRAGLTFEVLVSQADETYDPTLPSHHIAMDLAVLKTKAVLETAPRPHTIYLGADTIVVLDEVIFGKPQDEDDARRMLQQLSGNTHHVITGVCLATQDKLRCFYEATAVTFKDLSSQTINDYLATGEPFDKAGAYGIQGEGHILVDHIEGDFDNVVGLPVNKVLAELEQFLADIKQQGCQN